MSLENFYGRRSPEKGSGFTSEYSLNKVIFDIEVSDVLQLNDTWPPTPVQPRLNRMNLMEALYHGDFSLVYNKFLEMPVNYFKMVTSMIVNEIMAAPIQVEDESSTFNRDLNKTVSNLLTHMIKYGTGIMRKYDEGFGVVDPRYFYPTPEGYIITTPYVSEVAETEAVDRILVERYNEDDDPNILYITEYEFDGGFQIQELVEGSEREEPTSPTDLVQVGRMPLEEDSEYGYRLYEDILPLALGISIAKSDEAYFHRYHSRPRGAFRGNDVDIEEGFNLMDTDTNEERAEKIQKGVDGVFPEHPGSAKIPEYVQGYEMIVWDGKGEDRRESIRMNEKTLFNIAGISVDIQGEQSQGRSGTATKHQRLLQYSTSEALKFNTQHAVEMVTGKKTTWPSVMDQDQMQEQAQAPTPDEQGGF